MAMSSKQSRSVLQRVQYTPELIDVLPIIANQLDDAGLPVSASFVRAARKNLKIFWKLANSSPSLPASFEA